MFFLCAARAHISVSTKYHIPALRINTYTIYTAVLHESIHLCRHTTDRLSALRVLRARLCVCHVMHHFIMRSSSISASTQHARSSQCISVWVSVSAHTLYAYGHTHTATHQKQAHGRTDGHIAFDRSIVYSVQAASLVMFQSRETTGTRELTLNRAQAHVRRQIDDIIHHFVNIAFELHYTLATRPGNRAAATGLSVPCVCVCVPAISLANGWLTDSHHHHRVSQAQST